MFKEFKAWFSPEKVDAILLKYDLEWPFDDELSGPAAKYDVHVLVDDEGRNVREWGTDVRPWSILVHHTCGAADGHLAWSTSSKLSNCKKRMAIERGLPIEISQANLGVGRPLVENLFRC